MGTPQVLAIILMTLSVILHGIKHGQDREGKYNIFLALTSVMIHVWILIEGGFFN